MDIEAFFSNLSQRSRTMASVNHQMPGYGSDYSNQEVLDLSRKSEVCYENRMHHQVDHARRWSTSPRKEDIVNYTAKYGSPDRSLDENYQVGYGRENGSPPSFYPEAKDNSNSPSTSRQGSPSYASCYPGTEHLSQYVLQAAFQQQMLLQQKPKLDSDAVSDAGSEGSHSSNFPIYSMISGRDGKMTRPFKAYPKDPLSFTAGFSSVDSMLDAQSAEKYSAFRKRMLDQICAANGGQATVSNPKMRRTVNTNNNNYTSDDGKEKYQSQDNSYSERRKKNNAAAKKSRDRRRIKEDEIAIRAAFLERENIELRFELSSARKQLATFGITAVPSNPN